MCFWFFFLSWTVQFLLSHITLVEFKCEIQRNNKNVFLTVHAFSDVIAFNLFFNVASFYRPHESLKETHPSQPLLVSLLVKRKPLRAHTLPVKCKKAITTLQDKKQFLAPSGTSSYT